MKVKDICSRAVRSCSPETSLADAGWAMWEADCGVLPILEENGKVVGMLTDRDLAIGASTQYRPAAGIAAREAASKKLFTCGLEDDVRSALQTMRQEKVRRLPVVDAEGKLKGILSINDIALAAVSGKTARSSDLTCEDLVEVLQAVGEHRPAPREKAVPLQIASPR